MDEESHMRGIVLFIDESNYKAICYSKQLECLITVKLPLEQEVKRGQRVVIGDHDYSDSDGIYTPVRDHIMFEDDETVRFDGKEMLISTIAGCSVQSCHPTYAMGLAYAGSFGHVLVTPEMASVMERGIAYQCELSINNFDFDNKGIPLFRIAKVHRDMPPEDADEFLRSLYEYENARSTTANENTNTSSIDSSSSVNEIANLATNAANIELQSSNSSSQSTTSQSSNSPLDDQTEKNKGPSEPPKPFRFGAQPPNVERASQEVRNQTPSFTPQGKEVEHCLLVLHFGNSEIIGYETTLLKLMKVDVRKVNPQNISAFGVIRFVAEGFENGRTIPKEDTFRYTVPSQDVIWANEGGKIPAQLVFSNNRSHRTFNKSWGFSNYYGFIDVGDRTDNLDHSKVYSTYIAIRQWEDPLQPIFSSVSRLVEERIPFSEDFAQSMSDFEQLHAADVEKNGLASSNVPRSYDPPRHYPNKKPKRKTLPDQYTGLLVATGQQKVGGRDTGRFGLLWTQFGDAYFKDMPAINDTGVYVKLYSWISVRLQMEGTHDFQVTKVTQQVQPRETKVEFKENEVQVSANISSSSLLDYRDNNLRYYRHPLIGIIQTETELYFDGNNSVPVICRRRSGVRVRTGKEELCFWYAVPDESSRESEKCSSTPYASYEKGRNEPEHFPQYAPARDQNFHDYERGFNAVPNDYQSSSSQQYYQSPSPPQSHYENMRPPTLDHNPEFSPAPRGMDVSSYCSGIQPQAREGRALVVNRKKQIMILYLLEEKRAAFIQWKKFSKIRLGFELVCRYVPVDPSEENGFTSIEVIEILNYLDGNFETHIKDEESLAVFEVNLNQPMPGFNDYTRKSGNFVIYSQAAGPVLMDNWTRDTTNSAGSAARIVEEYRGKEGSTEMMALCSFCRCLVPANINEPYSNDKRDVVMYVWKITQIKCTKEHYIWSQEQEKINNLGPEFEKIEYEDEVHRQKKEAWKEYENRQKGCASEVSSNSGFFGNHPSRAQNSDWNHEQYVTPQGSVNNFGAGSSRSFHTAHGSQSGYQTPVPHGSHSGHPNQGRSDTTYQQHDFDALFRTIRSMQKAMSVFINNPDIRNHMSAVSRYDLNQLENSFASIEEIEARRRQGNSR